jgi:hypothetical protein
MGMIVSLYSVEETRVATVEQDENALFELLESDDDAALLDLDKAWHGLHFLLNGTAWEGQPPLNFLAFGGRSLDYPEGGYGPARYFNASQTQEIASAVTAVPRADLEARFDPTAMKVAEIYPSIWDRPGEELASWLGETFEKMGPFLSRTAASCQGVLVVIQ